MSQAMKDTDPSKGGLWRPDLDQRHNRRGRGQRGVPILLGLLALWLSACATLAPQAAEPISLPSATPSPSATATIVWFPPTDTPTPIPTRQAVPTVDQRPGLGEVILEDSFDRQGSWQTLMSASSSIAYGQQELTLAISAAKVSLSSLRNGPELSDFYLEITANPNLCRGKDSYGLWLRASDPQNGYRLLLSCDGLLRMERLKNGQIALLQDWAPSGQVPPGSPLVLRLGVWAFASELRIFINDVFQFSVVDPVWSSGKVGVFARSAADSPLTVNFSQLVVRRLFSDSTTPPTTHTAAPLPTSTAPEGCG